MNPDSELDSNFAPTSSVNRGKDTRFAYGCLAVYSMMTTLAVPIAFVIGHMVSTLGIYNNRAEYQQTRIEEYLNKDPEDYRQLEVEHASNGWAYPLGSVNSQEDYDRLSQELHRMFGDELSEQMMYGVEIQ